jgi:hypothetical protein
LAEEKSSDRDVAAQVPVLSEMVEGVVSDASELIVDLAWGVKTYLIFGVIMMLFGVQTLVYNLESIQEQLYIPVFIAGCMLFAGSVQILNYLRLRKKYARLFRVQRDLKR